VTALLIIAAVYFIVAMPIAWVVRDMLWYDRGAYLGAVLLWPYLLGGVAVCKLLRRIPWR
jgi:hypothetical protein